MLSAVYWDASRSWVESQFFLDSSGDTSRLSPAETVPKQLNMKFFIALQPGMDRDWTLNTSPLKNIIKQYNDGRFKHHNIKQALILLNSILTKGTNISNMFRKSKLEKLIYLIFLQALPKVMASSSTPAKRPQFKLATSSKVTRFAGVMFWTATGSRLIATPRLRFIPNVSMWINYPQIIGIWPSLEDSLLRLSIRHIVR